MPCPINSQPDPFREARRKDGVLVNEFQGKPIPMILRHEDLRNTTKDWQTFSSDAPLRVPIPSEEDVRTVRQLPLEIDPPEHADYRAIAEPFFNRAKLPEVIAQVEALVRGLLSSALQRESIEIVREFAIPLQSRALALLLNMPLSEAEVWIGWGTHVFREGDGKSKGAALEKYMNGLFDRGEAEPSDSFFSQLSRATFRGRPLTREEMLGYGSIMFAGGRDTVINSISGVIGHLAASPSDLEFLREDTKRIVNASEEFFRAISPVTHIGRVCPAKTEVHGVSVEPGALVTLCFASANYDETVFSSPEEVRLDRKPNPHVAFGFGPHLCLGAPHARLVVRTLLKCLCEQVGSIVTLAKQEKVEREERYNRTLAYDSLTVRFTPRAMSQGRTT
ncbi:MAG: cytochrome P450 [Methylacidiphilales bacterium]|nr:cytochrome P450 [Candidatus Methylacidiphilales bacterium]